MAYNDLALVYQNQDNYHKAIKNFKKAIELDPEDFMFYTNLGNYYLSNHEAKEAVAQY